VPVIPSKANRIEPRETDFALYRERNLVERFFNKLKHFRAIVLPHAAYELLVLPQWMAQPVADFLTMLGAIYFAPSVAGGALAACRTLFCRCALAA